MPVTQQVPNIYANPLANNALEGVKAELLTKPMLLLAAEAQRMGGIVVGDRLFSGPKAREEADQYLREVKAQGGPLASQIDFMTADFTKLGSQESRIADDAKLLGLQLTEGQKLSLQADTQRLRDLGGNADGGLAQGYNNLNLLLQGDSMRASAALDEELNPEQAAIRKQLGQDVQSDLALGNSLSASQRRSTEQSVRSGAAARNNILGNSSLLQEADSLMTEGERQKNIRQARGYAFLDGGSRNTGLFGTTAAEGSGLDEGMVSGNADFGAINANAGEWGTSSLTNSPPPKKKKSNGWGQVLGTVASVALGYFTGGASLALTAGMMSANNGNKS